MQNHLREKDNELTAVKVSLFGCVRAHAVYVFMLVCVASRLPSESIYITCIFVTSYQNMWDEAKDASAREQKLVVSAFYEMGLEVHTNYLHSYIHDVSIPNTLPLFLRSVCFFTKWA